MQPLSPKQLELAEAELHRQVFSLITVAQQGEVITKEGIAYTYSTNGPQPGGMVLFPSLNHEQAGAQLDDMMDYYRAQKARGIGCYSLEPPQPSDLGIRLLARGFQPGWKPCWMSRDLSTVPDDLPIPPGIEIRPDNNTSTHAETALPYHGDKGIGSHLMLKAYPQRLQRFLAIKDGKIVGQSCAFLTTSYDNKVAGIFNVGVVPEQRKQGIGKAVVLAACKWAAAQGYDYALLNATGKRMYMQAGFKYIGDGHTWWLMSDRYITHPPTKNQVLLAEAVGRGDIDALDRLSPQLTADDLNVPIANNMSLYELASHCRQPAVADWLDRHGAQCTPLDAWELGWKERAAAILAHDPQQVNRTYGHMQETLLHIAAEKNDLELARLALSFKPDLTLQDCVHHGTALDWANFFGRTAMAALIQKNG